MVISKNLKSYISNRSIAWDYANRYIHFPNGAIYIRELGFDVAFIVKTDNTTQRNYVYVFQLDLKPQKFGLKVPTTTENRNRFNHIISETINHYIKDIITESQESKSIDAAKKLYMQRMGCSREKADEFVRFKLRNDLLRTAVDGYRSGARVVPRWAV